MSRRQKVSITVLAGAVRPEDAEVGFRRVKVAASSMKPRKWDKAWNVKAVESFFRRAARRGVEIAVAPEGVIEGYVIPEILKDPSLAPEMLEIAEPMTGPVVRKFQSLARELRMCLAFGFAERVKDNAFNTAIFIDHRGRICGKHAKTQLNEGYHKSWYFNRLGDRLRAFDTPFGRAGFIICNERWNSSIVRALVLDGAQFLMILTFGQRGRAQNEAVLARARENGVPIIQSNVGMNLIVSKGEIAAYDWGCDKITYGTIAIPQRPSKAAARAAEKRWLKRGPARMKKQLQQTVRNSGRGCLTPPRP